MAKLSPVQELDFQQLKTSLKTFLKQQDRFKDYDFEGSNINALLDILAYNGYYHSFYYNMAVGESFISSAQQRNSVVSHAKELNYLPRSRVSSRARINMTVAYNPPGNLANASTITIPKFTRFSGRCGNQTYIFLTDRAHSGNLVAGTNTYIFENIDVYEGRIVTETMSIDNTVISNPFVDTRSVEVKIYENETEYNLSQNTSVDNGVSYTYRKDIFGIGAEDTVFYLQPEMDDRYSLDFGQNVFGVQPTVNNVIEVTYRITSGEQANGVRRLTLTDENLGFSSVNVIMQEISKGGAYAEDIESIRKFAPKALQVQERAVTKRDYEVLLRQRFPSIQAISVYGGNEVDPPRYGKVIISVDVQGSEGASNYEVTAFRDYLASKTPLTIEPIFVAANFMYVGMTVNVTYDSNLTTKSSSEIRELVKNAILEYQTQNLNQFNITLRQSDLAAYIDDLDPAMFSTDIVSKPIIEYTPSINVPSNPSFTFGTELLKPYPLNETVGFSDFKPAIVSTPFVTNNTVSILQDDGAGNIDAISLNVSGRAIVNKAIGSVDYATGRVSLSNFEVQSFQGDVIKFTASTVKKDIRSTKDRILIVREEDLNITVNPITES